MPASVKPEIGAGFSPRRSGTQFYILTTLGVLPC
jgi:hypothetical protein